MFKIGKKNQTNGRLWLITIICSLDKCIAGFAAWGGKFPMSVFRNKCFFGVFIVSLFGCFLMNEHDCTDGSDEASIGSCSINAQSTNN